MWYRRFKLAERIKVVMNTTTYAYQHFKHIEPAGELDTLEEYLFAALDGKPYVVNRIIFKECTGDIVRCYSEAHGVHLLPNAEYHITVRLLGVEDI